MANQRKLRLQRFGISEARYDELSALCRQYDEWSRRIREICRIENVTDEQKEKMQKYQRKKSAFDEAMRITVTHEYGLEKPLFEYLVHKKRFESLSVPMDKKAFYEFRTAFFVNFDKLI